ncbi:MAG: VanZ family protein [Tenuifilaceae bacterium]
MRNFIHNHWKSVVWAIVILILCGMPGDDLNKVKFIDIPHLDKIVHGFLYFVFTLLLISENNSQKAYYETTMSSIIIAAIIALSYGMLIEVLQKILFINRGAEILDMVANTIGFLVAVIFYRQINRITKGYI